MTNEQVAQPMYQSNETQYNAKAIEALARPHMFYDAAGALRGRITTPIAVQPSVYPELTPVPTYSPKQEVVDDKAVIGRIPSRETIERIAEQAGMISFAPRRTINDFEKF